MKRMLLVGSVAAVAILALASPASARATRTPVTFYDTTVSQGQPARQWVSGHVFHLRGEVDVATVTGDLQGTLTLEYGINVNFLTGHGTIAGSFVLATADVSWAGAFHGKLTPTGASGRFVGQGSGGSKLLGTFTSIAQNMDLDQAVILQPHG